jgi:hypothetical protein
MTMLSSRYYLASFLSLGRVWRGETLMLMATMMSTLEAQLGKAGRCFAWPLGSG